MKVTIEPHVSGRHNNVHCNVNTYIWTNLHCHVLLACPAPRRARSRHAHVRSAIFPDVIWACTYGIILALKQDKTVFSLKLSPVRYFQIMAATERHEQEMKKKSAELARTATDPLEMLRHKCLARGASGIKGIGRQVSPALESQCMKSMKYACK